MLARNLRLIFVALLGCVVPSMAQDRQLQIQPAKVAPAGEKRLALVIGNSAYKTSPLRNPVNDARAIGKALSQTGFKVTVVEDASQTTMRRAIRTFGDELAAAGGVGVFYFAGHGMQVKGKNFLIPVNADIEREDEVEDGAVDANFVMQKMDSAKNALNLVILDACRNNPFARSFRSGSQGLAQMDAPSGTLVAFATAPGSVAADGDGDNGLYTKHLLASLSKPGLAVEQLFKEVRIGVTRETKDRQVPWESSSLKGNFYFVPGEATLSAEEQRREMEKQIAERVAAERAEVQRQMQKVIADMLAKQKADLEEERRAAAAAAAGAVAAAPKPAAPPPPDKLQMELVFWESIKASTNPQDFKAYLDQYPQGTFAILARNRVAPPPAPVVAAAPAAPAPAPAAPKPAPVQVSAAPVPAVTKPIEPPKAPEAPKPAAVPAPKPEPVQVASIAPTTSLVGMGIDNPRFPKIGDQWVYQYADTYGKQKFTSTTEVTAVSPEGILDTSVAAGRSPSARAHAAGMQLAFVGPVLQLSPYVLSFGDLKQGQVWRALEAQGAVHCYSRPGVSCDFAARVVGREKITVAGGTFDAVKIIVDQNQRGSGWFNWREYVFWYSETAKRVVKSSVRTKNGVTQAPDYDVELVSYKLN